MTAWCWGFGWSDETIDKKTRSMMNLTMIAAIAANILREVLQINLFFANAAETNTSRGPSKYNLGRPFTCSM